jgi:hypothetical protein
MLSLIIDVKVVLYDPALGHLQIPMLVTADRNHDPSWFSHWFTAPKTRKDPTKLWH